MNTLSVLLYSVDMLSSLEVFFRISGAVLCGAAVVFLIARSETYDEEEKKVWSKRVKIALYVAFISLLLAVFIPSERTMYLIAGSELGEDAITSDTGKKVHDAINKKLDEYLNPAIE